MTRHKKEVIRKIREIDKFIMVDSELGCGSAPAGAYDSMYDEIYRLQEQLAELSHYGSVEEMLYDNIGCKPDENIPFI